MRNLMLFSAVTLSCYGVGVAAETNWQHCDSGSTADFLPVNVNENTLATDVRADKVQIVGEGTSIFTGNVEVTQAGQELKSDRATYNRVSGKVTAQTDVQIIDSDSILNAEQAEWDLSKDEGSLINADYRLRESHARGEASYVFRQGVSRTKLKVQHIQRVLRVMMLGFYQHQM